MKALTKNYGMPILLFGYFNVIVSVREEEGGLLEMSASWMLFGKLSIIVGFVTWALRGSMFTWQQ